MAFLTPLNSRFLITFGSSIWLLNKVCLNLSITEIDEGTSVSFLDNHAMKSGYAFLFYLIFCSISYYFN